jgi:hypothetical protein
MKILAPQRKPPHRLEETQQKTNFPPIISSWERKGKSDEAVLTRETHRRHFSPSATGSKNSTQVYLDSARRQLIRGFSKRALR